MCITARHVCFCVPLCDRVSERVWCCYSSREGRCKKNINTQLGARGYSTPSNTARATMGSWICHSEGSVENMRGARRMVNKGGKMNGYTHGEAVLDLDTVFLLSAYRNSCPAYVDVNVCVGHL